MARFDGSAALKLDFGGMVPRLGLAGARSGQALRLTPRRGLRGPDKYQVLEHRRRQAQIKARRLLDLLEGAE